jgi:hypothetical protein
MNKNEDFQKLNTEEEIKQRTPSEPKPEKRRIRKESPPPLRPYGKKPWRTIITVNLHLKNQRKSIFLHNFSHFFFCLQGFFSS